MPPPDTSSSPEEEASPLDRLSRTLLPAPADTAAAPGRRRWDVVMAMLLALAAGFASYQGSAGMNPALFDWPACDEWFEADLPRVVFDMTGTHNDHYRTKVHPLFPILTLPAVKIVQRGFGVSEMQAVRLVVAGAASMWVAAFFSLVRLAGCRRLDASIFTCLCASSAAAMLWAVVPETYPFGSLSIVLTLIVVAAARWKPVPMAAGIAASALSLSFTITNWMAGLAMAVCAYPRRKAIVVSFAAFAVVMAIWGVEKVTFPSSRFLISDAEDLKYVLDPDSGGPARVAASFFLHTMVAPSIIVKTRHDPGAWTDTMGTQHSTPGSASAMGSIALPLWVGLLIIGALALTAGVGDWRLRAALRMLIAGQFLLHLLYGSETFLYSLHFLPLLGLLAALGSQTRLRPLVLTAAVACAVLAAGNNLQQLRLAKAHVNGPHITTPDIRTLSKAPGHR